MIIEAVMNLIKTVLLTIFGVLPNIPDVPDISNSIMAALDIVIENGSVLLGLFIRPATIQIALPVLLVISNFEKIYELTMFVLKKIPFLGIK